MQAMQRLPITVLISNRLYLPKILDHDGNVMVDNTTPESHQVIKETTAFLLTDAMVDVVTKGTGGSVNFGGDVAIAWENRYNLRL